MKEVASFLKVLSDATRLRLVRLLSHEALNVGELVRILGLAQSSVSHQLAELKRSALVKETREGGYTYYELVRPQGHNSFKAIMKEVESRGDPEGDLARLGEVLRERADRGASSEGKLVEPGRSWAAWARGLKYMLPRLRVADFGCGDGALTREIASWAADVVAIDRDQRLLELARDRMKREKARNVKLVHEELERLSLSSASRDLVVISQVLHQTADPQVVLAQARRVLVRRGRVLVFELMPHEEHWVRDKLGHVWLGFPPRRLSTDLGKSGFRDVETEPVPGKAGREPFRVFVATGVRP